MARSVRVEDDEVVVELSGLTAVAALKRELRIPRAAIVSASAGVPEQLGWRKAGTSVPWTDYKQGRFSPGGRKAFYSFEHRDGAVTLELDGGLVPGGWERVVVGVDDPEALLRYLGTASSR